MCRRSAPPAAVDSAPRLDLKLKPVVASPRVEVVITAHGSPAELARWTVARQARVSRLSARDDGGEIVAQQRGLDVTFGREVRGALTVSYSAATGPFTVDAPSATALDPNHFRGAGESLLVLPAAFEQRPVPVRVVVDATDLGPDASGASSLGPGSEQDMELSAQALRRSTFVAGPLGRARFDAPEGIDRAVWLGFTSFDPRQVAAEVAGFRTGARQYFNAHSAPPLTLLVVSDSRRPGRFEVARRTASLLVHVGVAQAWDAPLRLAVYPQVLREWIGSELSIAPLDAGDPVEPAWFVDGMSRHLARQLGFRFGLLTPEENAEEVEHLLALYATSPYKKTPLHALKSQPDRDAALTQAVVRGALYALLLDARLRDKSGGKRSLDDVLRTLFAEARKAQAPLSPKAFSDAVAETLGEQALILDQGTLRGDTPIVLPANALGHCFAPRKQSVTPFVLGLDRVRRRDRQDDRAARRGTRRRSWASGRRRGPRARLPARGPARESAARSEARRCVAEAVVHASRQADDGSGVREEAGSLRRRVPSA